MTGRPAARPFEDDEYADGMGGVDGCFGVLVDLFGIAVILAAVVALAVVLG